MLAPWLFLFLGFFFGGLIFVKYLFMKGPGTGSYFGDPNMTREKFYEDFLNHVDYLTVKAREENCLYISDANELERKLDEIKLFAPENVYDAAKKLFNYNLTHFRDRSASRLAGYSAVRKQYIDATKKDI